MPDSLVLGLSADQLAERRKGIGGSDANVIMSGDERRIIDLWQEKRGEREPDDLSRVLPVQLGSFTEPFNRHWYGLTTGRPVSCVGEVRQHAEHSFMRCTLDGMTDGAVWEAKHVNPFSNADDVAQRYMPQLHHNMACCGVGRAVLSVLIGTMKYEVYEVALDDFYLCELIDREREFWRCVETGDAPFGFTTVEAPKIATKLREVDMTGSNAWASYAADWLANKSAAKTFDTAAKELKALVEADVGRAHGHGIEIKRSKSGALSVKEL